MWTAPNSIVLELLGPLAANCVAMAENETALFLAFSAEQQPGELRHRFGSGPVSQVTSADHPFVYEIPND